MSIYDRITEITEQGWRDGYGDEAQERQWFAEGLARPVDNAEAMTPYEFAKAVAQTWDWRERFTLGTAACFWANSLAGRVYAACDTRSGAERMAAFDAALAAGAAQADVYR